MVVTTGVCVFAASPANGQRHLVIHKKWINVIRFQPDPSCAVIGRTLGSSGGPLLARIREDPADIRIHGRRPGCRAGAHPAGGRDRHPTLSGPAIIRCERAAEFFSRCGGWLRKAGAVPSFGHRLALPLRKRPNFRNLPGVRGGHGSGAVGPAAAGRTLNPNACGMRPASPRQPGI